MSRENGSYLKIGLTGGIGSGKTTAAKRFAALGACVYHADEISRHALDPCSDCYVRVIATFGMEIVRNDGTIDRRRLGEIVFADESKRRALNDIIHPYVINELFSSAERDLANDLSGIAVFEVPLLFESGMDAQMDANIVVTCDDEARIQRVMERDQLPREQVLSRIRAQMPEEEKRKRADYILENNGTHESLLHQVDALYAALKVKEPEI
ncbi:MAG: dephospho-CoA kinase [Clostridiaceae bacterium]